MHGIDELSYPAEIVGVTNNDASAGKPVTVVMDCVPRHDNSTNGDMTIDLPLDANGSTKKMSPHESVTPRINGFFPWCNGCIMQAILGTISQW